MGLNLSLPVAGEESLSAGLIIPRISCDDFASGFNGSFKAFLYTITLKVQSGSLLSQIDDTGRFLMS